MARLCIRIAPNNHPTDPKLDALRTQVGDVVCIVDDEHIFSEAEMNCGQYQFVDVPGVPQGDLINLCTAVADADGNIIARRSLAIDLAALDNTTSSKATGAVIDGSALSTFTKADIDAVTIAKV